MPIPRIVVGFRVQWLLQVLQRGRSASARRVLRNCLWCGILYRVRDPGASRRASLKPTGANTVNANSPVVPCGDPGASRRASLKRVAGHVIEDPLQAVIPALRAGPH